MKPKSNPEDDALAPIVDPRASASEQPGASAAPPIDLVLDGSHATIWLTGDIDLNTSADLAAVGIRALADPRVTELTVDNAAVTLIDSTGLGALVRLRSQADASAKRMTLRRVPPSMRKVLALTQLNQMFGLTDEDTARC